MGSPLGCLFGLLLALLMFLLVAVANFIRRLKSLFSPFQSSQKVSKQQEEKKSSSAQQTSRNKVFDDDEGEYIDFEEVQ